MGAPLKTIQTIRVTAKILLAATPLMILSGFLTAKPFLLESLDFTTARLIHTIIAPAVFIPLLVAHSTAGVYYLLNRSKRIKSPKGRGAIAALWAILLALLSALYFLGRPQEIPLDEALDEQLTSGSVDADADGDEPADSGRDDSSETTDGDDEIEDEGAIALDSAPIDGSLSIDSGERATRRQPARTDRKAQRRALTKTRPRVPTRSDTKQEIPPSKQVATEEEGTPEKAPTPSGSKLVRERCLGCHPLATIYGKKRTSSEWRGVVGRMVAMGAKLDSAERQAVLRHLISSYGADP